MKKIKYIFLMLIILLIPESVFAAEYSNFKILKNVEIKETTCKVLFSGEFGILLGQAFDIIKFAVPILIIGLGVVDYVKALAAQNQDEVKRSTNKLIKRLIIGIIIFLLPTLIEFALGIVGYGLNDGHCFDWLR